jgi:hypothetical protein
VQSSDDPPEPRQGPAALAAVVDSAKPTATVVPRAGGPPPAVRAGQLGGPVSWHATYPPVDSCASLARIEVAGALTRAGVRGQALDDAMTVVTELVANAIVHAATPFTVIVDAGTTGVRVDVRDGSPLPPHFLGPPGCWPGFGLHIVAALASAWGWQLSLTGPGKGVWAQLEWAQERTAQ